MCRFKFSPGRPSDVEADLRKSPVFEVVRTGLIFFKRIEVHRSHVSRAPQRKEENHEV